MMAKEQGWLHFLAYLWPFVDAQARSPGLRPCQGLTQGQMIVLAPLLGLSVDLLDTWARS